MPTQTKPALPFAPYEGAEPYIFVSYAHANADRVYPIIGRLHGMGYRLWYDEGIEAGDEWPEVIGDHIMRAACMLLFLSPEAVKSKWVKKEIHAALTEEIKVVGTFLMETNLPSSLFLQLSDVQMLFYADEAYWDRLTKGIPEDTLGKVPISPQKRVYIMRQRPKQIPVLIAPQPKSAPKPELASVFLPPPLPFLENDFRWDVGADAMITLVVYDGVGPEVIIPRTYQGMLVTKIGTYAVAFNEQIQSVIIPEGVSAIEGSAFGGCISLVDIWAPASIKSIAESAFESINNPRNPNLTFHCPRNSYAEQYAKDHKINIKYTD